MGFFPSLASVIRAASVAAIAILFAAGASADDDSGPSDRAPPRAIAPATFCSLRASGASGNAVAFAAGVVIVAIAARRRGADA